MSQTKFAILRTEYVRYTKFRVIQVQIHLEDKSAEKLWFEEKHLQEILQLLKPVIFSRCENFEHNKESKNSDNSAILTGTSVRIGYGFKKKWEHHTCLLPRNMSQTTTDDDSNTEAKNIRSGIYRYFHVHKEKLVVFVCPLTDSSQNMMTQLLSIVKGAGKSSTVEISSYFQKSPQNKQTTSLSSGQEKQSESSKPKSSSDKQSDPKDKIKNIIKRSGPKLSKKRQLSKPKINVQPPEELGEKEQNECENLFNRNEGSGKKRVLVLDDDGVEDEYVFTRKKFPKRSKYNEDYEQNVLQKNVQKMITDAGKNQNMTDRDQEEEEEADVLSSSKHKLLQDFGISKDSCSSEENDCPMGVKKPASQTRKSSKTMNKNPGLEIKELRIGSQAEDKSSITQKTEPTRTLYSKTESKSLMSESTSATNRETPKSSAVIFKSGSKETLSQNSNDRELNKKEKTLSDNSKKEIYENDFSYELPGIDFPIPEIKTTITCAPSKTDSLLTMPGDFDLPKIKIGERVNPKPNNDVNKVEKNEKNNYKRLLNVRQYNSEINNVKLRNSDNGNKDFISCDKDDENSDSPDSSTPNLVKTRARLRCPRLSSIHPVIETNKHHEGTDELPILKTKVLRVKNTVTANISDHENLRIDNPVTSKVKQQVQESSSARINSTGSIEKITLTRSKNIAKENFSSESFSTDEEMNAVCVVNSKRKTKTIQGQFSDNSVDDFRLSKPVLPVLTSKRKRKQPETKPTTKRSNVKSQNTNNYNFFSSPASNSKKPDKSVLDYFKKSKSPVVRAIKPIDFESTDHQADESFDILLIEELSEYPKKIKDESSLAIRDEISRIDDVSLLNREQIREIIFKLEDYLRNIFQGKVVCERHEDYKRGGMNRHNLNYQVNLALFTDEQHDVVMETLMEIFCKRHHKYLDYLLKVLLPEILIKIHMEVNGTSREETELIMNNA